MPLFDWEKVSRSNPYYKACLTGLTAGGAILGGAVTAPVGAAPVGYVSGAGLGLAIGYLACPYIAPRLKEKLDLGDTLQHDDIASAVEAMHRYVGVKSANEAVKLVAIARANITYPASPPLCTTPQRLAKQLAQRHA
jgi:hypothetical protein